MEQVFSNLPLIVLIGIFAVALVVLTKASDVFVESAVSISEKLKLSPLIIGVVIVSLGTTLPEVATTVASVMTNTSELALGNAVGSIVTNFTLVIGLGAVVGTLPILKSVGKNLNFLNIVMVIFIIIAYLTGKIPQWFGCILVILLPLFFIWTIRDDKKETILNDECDVEYQEALTTEQSSIVGPLIKLIIGAVLVAGAASILVDTVKVGGGQLGISPAIIGATVVAFGTSLPEMMTAITAAKKGHTALAIGNVIGANILNLVLVLGLAVAMNPAGLVIPSIYLYAIFPLLLVIMVILTIFVYHGKINEINTREGLILLILYGVFIGLNLGLV
jgi:cation:H+ antiporter